MKFLRSMTGIVASIIAKVNTVDCVHAEHHEIKNLRYLISFPQLVSMVLRFLHSP